MALDLSNYFGGTAPTTATSSVSDTSSALPAWLQDYTRGLMAQGTGVFAQPFQQYNGPRLTDINDYAQSAQGMQMSQNNVGSWQPSFSQAGQAYQTANQTVPQGVQSYMNPYVDNVVNRIGELGQRNLTENLLPQVNSTFTGAGQFGSSRNADFTNRAIRDVNDNVLGQQSQALQTGYQNAVQNFGNDMTRMASLGNSLQQYGQNTSQLGNQDAQTMYNLGNIQKTQDQQSYDLGYNQFLEQRDYPKTQIEFMNSIVRGLPVTQSAFKTSSAIPTASASQLSPSPLSAVGSALTGGASTSNMLSSILNGGN